MTENVITYSRFTGLSAILFEGRDADEFLQGQLSADMAGLVSGEWCRAAYCSPKGRALATMILLRRGEGVLLLLSSDIAEQTATSLKRYVLRSKVNITIPECTLGYTTGVDMSDSGIERGRVKEEGESMILEEGGMSLRVCFGGDSMSGSDKGAEWRRIQIERGIPWVNGKNTGMFIPQYINWELLGGINFQKGCYVGQEIIARLHYLGNIKRRGYVVRGEGEAPEVGIKMGLGEVINSEEEGEGFVCMLSATRDIGEELEWEGRKLKIAEPPYGLPTAEEDNKPRPKV